MSPSRRALLTLLKVSDLCVVTAAFICAIAVTGDPADHWHNVLEMRVKLQNALFMAAYLGYWHFVLRSRGLYRSYRLSGASRELRDLTTAVLIGVAPLIPMTPILRFQYASPLFLVAFAAAAFIGLTIERRLLRSIGRQIRRYGRNLRNVIIVGDGDTTLSLTSKLARRDDLGYHVATVVDTGRNGNGNGSKTSDVLEQVQQIIERQPIDEVFVALPLDTSLTLIRRLIALCEEQGIMARVSTQVASLNWARALVDEIEGEPVVTVYTGPPETPRLLVKRAVDLFGAGLGLLICLPLFLIVSLLILLDSKGPVFFLQERVGYQRRRFRAFKFRTMVDGAEGMQADLEPLNEASGPVFKIQNDPRVTRVGKWLRRFSIDELPQLFNVLKGEMSLVGPRPLPVRDVDRIDVRWHKRRFSVKPGVTCLWQVYSREPEFNEWIKLDMEYIDNWSLALDLKILAKTIPAVISGQGAH